MEIKILMGFIISLFLLVIGISFFMYSNTIEQNPSTQNFEKPIQEKEIVQLDLEYFFDEDYEIEDYQKIYGEYDSPTTGRIQGSFVLWIYNDSIKELGELSIFSLDYITKFDSLDLPGVSSKTQSMIVGPVHMFIPQEYEFLKPLYIKSCYLDEHIESRNEKDFSIFIQDNFSYSLLDTEIDRKNNCVVAKFDSTYVQWGIFSTEDDEITELFLK